MKTYNLLPSSPKLRDMNDAQWVWCYLNILEDQKEEEDLWKARLKYMGLFVNPEAVTEMSKIEQRENDPNYIPAAKSFNGNDDPVYSSSTFEDEMRKAMQGEDFMELPDPDVKGNPNMSSEEFTLSVMGNIDQFSAIQQQIELDKQAKEQGLDYDLDVFEID
jgi:hypothetical protein